MSPTHQPPSQPPGELHLLHHTQFDDGPIYALAAQANRVYCAGSSRIIRCAFSDQPALELASLDATTFALALDHKGDFLLAGGAGGRLTLLDLRAEPTRNSAGRLAPRAKIVASTRHGNAAILSLCFDVARQQIISASADGTLAFVDLDGLQIVQIAQVQPTFGTAVRRIRLINGGTELLVCGNSGLICIIDLEQRRRVWTATPKQTSDQQIYFDALHTASGNILTAGKDGRIVSLCGQSGAIQVLYQHAAAINALQIISLDGVQWLAAATRDKLILLLDCLSPGAKQKNHAYHAFKAHARSVNALATTSNMLVSAGDDAGVRFWTAKQ